MKETSGWKVTGSGRNSFWRQDPAAPVPPAVIDGGMAAVGLLA